jgi:hypothetical protein
VHTLRTRLLLVGFAAAILLGILTPHAAGAITFVASTPIAGDSVPVTVTLVDASGGNGVDVTVSIPAGQGDLLGFFGNATPETLVPSMAVVDASGLVTQWQFAANQVWKVGGGNVMSPVKNWDFGLRFASQGSAGGAVTSASFRLTAPGLTTAGLVNAFNQGWRFGIRIQSTLGPEGSAKIGVASTALPVGEAPTIGITTPVDGALIGSSNVTVSGTVMGTAPVAVSVNGVAATVTGSTWSAAIVLADGAHTLTATASNSAGSATDSVAVTVDTSPPVVTITAPAYGTQTIAALVTVAGTVTDASPIASFIVNGVAVSLADGAFTTAAPLGLGGNPITAEATDAAGNTGSDGITVVRGEAPAIAITVPADGLLTHQTPLTVSGTVSGTAPVAVSVNGIAAPVTGESWSVSVALVEGANTLAAGAANAFGSASAAVSVTLDATPPVVTITTPAEGAQTAAGSVVVEGTAVDASPITALLVNGLPVSVVGGSFTTTVSLAAGANPITAVAVDAADNTGSDAITVTRGAAPTVAITAPADGLLTNQTSIAVSGSVTGSAPLAVDVGGIAAAVTGGTWAATVPLVEGANPLTATATNAFGAASGAVAVTRDTTPPVVSITTPMSGATFTSSPVTVSGVVLDASAFALAVNGVAVSVSGSSFSASVALTPGSNTLTAVATDAAGNAGSAGVTVTLQIVTPLAMTIDSPPAGSLISADRVTVAGTVGDPAARVVVNGVTATVTGSQYVATNVPVVEGENLLTASATAAGGREGQAAVSVTFNLPPKIMITSPRDGAALDVNELDVMGFVDDSAALVRVNGVAALVSSDGSFLAPAVPLAPDANEITASAVDLLGAAGEDRITVFFDEDGDEAALRLALVDPGRCSFPVEQSCDPVVLVARDLDEFRAGMERLNQPLGLFSPEALVPGVGDRDFQVYAFAEVDGSLSLDVESVSSLAPAEPTQPLVPLAGLSADLLSIGLDPALESELIPNDIDTAFFARFDLIGAAPFLAQDVAVQMETNEKLRNLAANPIGIGNQWTIMWRFLFPSVGTNPTFVELSAPGGAQADKIRLAWKGTLPRYFEAEIVGADGTSKKVWRWNNALPAANFFMSPALVWDGAELRLYQSGFLDEADAKPADDTVVQTDTPRRLTIENGSMVYHSLVVWDRALGQSEIAALQSFTAVITDLSSNAGAYSGAPNLEHWWRFGFDAGDVGKDYGNAAVPIDADVDAVGIDASDVVAKRPPGFANLPEAGFAAVRAFLGSVSSSLSLFLDRSPPEVSITSPVAGSILAGNGVTVIGSVKDRAFSSGFADASPIFGSLSYRVTDSLGAEIAGGEAALHEGSFAIDDLALGEGLHCVAVTALDLGGNVGADEACFTTDPNAPAVTLVSPLDGTSLLETAIPVTLNFSTLTTLISVNGASDGRSFGAGLASDVISLPLAMGANPTRLIFDAGSGPFELAFTLFRIDGFRDIQIVSPEQGAMRSGATVRVTGRAPRGTPAVQVNGINASIAADHVTFTADVPLHSGSNEIRAVELAFGRSDVVTVVRDNSAPKFLATFPGSGAVTPDASVHFAGFVSEAARVTARNGATSVSVQAVPVSVPGDPLLGIPTTAYRFELPALALTGGPNAIVLLASDQAGTETELPLTIVQDAGALSLVAPANGATVPALRTDLSFEASADLVIEAVYSGALRLPAFEGHAVGTGPLTLADVPLAPGPNELRVAYRRTSGGAQVLRFGLLSAAASTATIGGTVTDASSGQPIAYALVSLVVGGQTVVVATGADGRYSAPIEPGAVEVMATAGGFAPGMLTVTANNGSAVTADVAINSTGLPAFPNEVAIVVPPNGTVTDFEVVTVSLAPSSTRPRRSR